MKLPNRVIVKLSAFRDNPCRNLPPDAGVAWGDALAAASDEFDISTSTRQAMWLAQLIHESAGFTRLVENLNYTARRLSQVWPVRFAESPKAIDLGPNALAKSVEGNPPAIANTVYANRMGNGAPSSGDGWRFRGRYPLQLTGRDAYQQCHDAIGVPDMADPDALLKDIPGMARVCGWFWQWKKLSPIADEGLLAELVRRWNGGLIGLEERSRIYRDCMIALGA